MYKAALILTALLVVAGCDRSNPNRDLVTLTGEEAEYEPRPPLRDPPPGTGLPEPLYDGQAE